MKEGGKRMRLNLAWIALAMMAAGTAAQTVTGSGTAGTVPVFTGSGTTSTIGNSNPPITVSNSNVGIGTSSPQYTLHVNGSSYLSDNSQVWGWPFATILNPSPTYRLVNGIGNTGVIATVGGSGTSANANGLGTISLYVNGAYTVSNSGNSAGGAFVDIFSNPASVTIQSGAGTGFLAHYYAAQASSYSLNSQSLTEYGFFSNLPANPTAGAAAFAYYGNGSAPSYFGGNVGIGTTSPGARLEINGGLRFSGDASGTVQTTAWTGVLCGGDYAEAVTPSGGKHLYEPGDVLVLASDTNGNVERSHEPYSTLVAGIYATKPGVIGRRQSLVKDADELPMAMVGIVPTKVTAENGSIHQGDLLVTSSKSGYAMKGTDRTRLVGAVIGKAMGSLNSGTGVIEVLVTLQ
jgi:hypothetical protein